jgi:hypothetical protein
LEKIEKYQDLARELRKLWNTRTEVIPIVIGALGTLAKQFSERMRGWDRNTNLGTAKNYIITNCKNSPKST